MLVVGTITYASREIIRKFTEPRYERLREAAPDLMLPAYEGRVDFWPSAVVMDISVLEVCTEYGLTIEVSKVRGLHYNQSLPQTAQEVLNTIEAMNKLARPIINVSVPNVGLMDVRQVHWLEDCCTQLLQRYLDAGWRIVAVCPPNDSRRPTYIVGHTEKSAELLY